MKTKLMAAMGTVALLTAACGYSIKAMTDYDRNVNFASYQTFSIVKGNSSGNPVSDQRIADDVAAALTGKGWKEVPTDQPRRRWSFTPRPSQAHVRDVLRRIRMGRLGLAALGRPRRLRRRLDHVRQQLQGRHGRRRHLRRQDEGGHLARVRERLPLREPRGKRQDQPGGRHQDVRQLPSGHQRGVEGPMSVPPVTIVAVPDLSRSAVTEISDALRQLLADVFALYLKTKSFHWHVSGPHFRDYHLLLDEQADQIFAMTDPIAERARKIGGTTLLSIRDISRHQRLQDSHAAPLSPRDMMLELLEDNRHLTGYLRATHGVCETHDDVATASLIEVWIDETERRTWFLAETGRGL
jgi:starvation-inducible DNA-binding protein